MKSKINDFMKNMAELLEIDVSEVNLTKEISHFECWDSLALVSTIGMIDHYFGVLISAEKINECKTINDILEVVIISRAGN